MAYARYLLDYLDIIKEPSWPEITGLQQALKIDLSPWEAETLYLMVLGYQNMLFKGRDIHCPSPLDDHETEEEQQQKVESAFNTMRNMAKAATKKKP